MFKKKQGRESVTTCTNKFIYLFIYIKRFLFILKLSFEIPFWDFSQKEIDFDWTFIYDVLS